VGAGGQNQDEPSLLVLFLRPFLCLVPSTVCVLATTASVHLIDTDSYGVRKSANPSRQVALSANVTTLIVAMHSVTVLGAPQSSPTLKMGLRLGVGGAVKLCGCVGSLLANWFVQTVPPTAESAAECERWCVVLSAAGKVLAIWCGRVFMVMESER
jgi:hypothetical protein